MIDFLEDRAHFRTKRTKVVFLSFKPWRVIHSLKELTLVKIVKPILKTLLFLK